MGARHAAAGAEPLHVPTVEDWSEKNSKITVRTTPGSNLLADLVLRAKIDASPEEVYRVLIHPDSHSIFRGIKATLERRTLEDDGKGRRRVFVCHQAVTRFLWLQVTFSTQLMVEEDDRARTITFHNAREGGFMRTFTGRWEVSPFSQETLDRIYRPGDPQRQRGGWLSPTRVLGAIQHRLPGGHAGESSLVTLEQAVAPRVMPPGPLMRMVRGMCARTVSNMMADLQAEIERRRAAGGAAGGGKAAGQHHAGGHAAAAPPRGGGGAAGHAACLSAAALDLFAAAAPLNITIEL